MNKTTFSQHLGFSQWDDLIACAHLVAVEQSDRNWYITHTDTWYKWVVWSTKFDILFNNTSHESAIHKLHQYLQQQRIHSVLWCTYDLYKEFILPSVS